MEAQPTITWQELKDFCNTISDEFLDSKAHILISDDNQGKKLNEPYFLEEDVWCHKDGFPDEEAGNLEDLKAMDDKFNIEEYEIVTRKGTPFLWSEDL